MAYKDHRWMTPDALPAEAEILEVYQTTRQFYQEAQYRDDLNRHCAWYKATAEQHCREIEKMRGDINLFRFFCRRR